MIRREFVGAIAGYAEATRASLRGQPPQPIPPGGWRDAFPALAQRINGHPLT